jgi:hypothetical protein
MIFSKLANATFCHLLSNVNFDHISFRAEHVRYCFSDSRKRSLPIHLFTYSCYIAAVKCTSVNTALIMNNAPMCQRSQTLSTIHRYTNIALELSAC